MSHQRTPLANRIYLRGRTWWMWGYDYAGKRYRESTHQTERKAALEAARKIEIERAVPADPAQSAASRLTLHDALALLLAEDKRNGAKPKTVEFHRNRGRHLIRVLTADRVVAHGVFALADTNAYTDARLEELGDTVKHRHTIQKEIRVLVQALNVARENGLYFGEPKALRPKAFKKTSAFYKPGESWLEDGEQCQALLDATSNPEFGKVNTDRKLHIAAWIHTGARREELLAILPKDVDLEARLVDIDGTKTDGSRRIVALSDTAVEIFRLKLRAARPGQPLFEAWGKADRDLKANWKRARAALVASRRATGLDDEADLLEARLPRSLCCNDLRRTFCSLMAAAGVPAHHCADLLGHKSLDMVMGVYRRVAPASLHSAVAHLPALNLSVTAAVTTKMRRELLDAQAERAQRKVSG